MSMPRRKLSKTELKASRQEFVSGVRGIHKQEVHITQWELLLKRLGLSEANCIANVEVQAFCKKYRNYRFIPEMVLHRLGMETDYDLEPGAYSLVNGTVLPAPAPLEEEAEQDATPIS